MSGTSLLADAAAGIPETNNSITTSSSSSTSIASSHDIVTLSACFQFLSARELIQAHSTCRQWHLAAANPLTFRAQIRVVHRDHVGIVSTGPKVSFSRPNRMKLAFESSLFQNYRILHLIGAGYHPRGLQHREEWETMIRSTLKFKSFHTLRLSLSNLSALELCLSEPSDAGIFPTPKRDPNRFLLNHLFESTTCKYLQVLTLDITPIQFFFVVKDLFSHLPRNLRHLQLNLMCFNQSQSLIPDDFEEQIIKLTELQSLVIADDELRLLVHSRVSGVQKVETHRSSLFTLTESDIAKLSSLSTRMPTLDIRCIVCIDIEQLVTDNSPLIGKLLDSAAGASSSSVSAASPPIPAPLHLEEIYIKNVNVGRAFHGYLFHLLTRLAPRARCLTLVNASATRLSEELERLPHPYQTWPSTVVESLTSLQVIYGLVQSPGSNRDSQAHKYLGPVVLMESNLLFAAARFINLTQLSIGSMLPNKDILQEYMGDFFSTLPSLTHLSLYAMQIHSFSSLIPLRKLRIISGLDLSVAQHMHIDPRGGNGFRFTSQKKEPKEKEPEFNSFIALDGFQRALEHVTEISLTVSEGRLTSPLLTALLALPDIEKVRVNGGAPLSRKMLRIHFEKIEKIRKGFKQAAEGVEKLEEEFKAKRDNLGYKCDDPEGFEIEVSDEQRRSLRSSLVSTLQQAVEQEKIEREQLSHTEYEARVGGETDLSLSAAAKFRAGRSKKGPCVFDGSASTEPVPASTKLNIRGKKGLAYSDGSMSISTSRMFTVPVSDSSSESDSNDQGTSKSNSDSVPRPPHKKAHMDVMQELVARSLQDDSDDDDTPLHVPNDTTNRVIMNDDESVEEDELAAILCKFAKAE